MVFGWLVVGMAIATSVLEGVLLILLMLSTIPPWAWIARGAVCWAAAPCAVPLLTGPVTDRYPVAPTLAIAQLQLIHVLTREIHRCASSVARLSVSRRTSNERLLASAHDGFPPATR